MMFSVHSYYICNIQNENYSMLTSSKHYRHRDSAQRKLQHANLNKIYSILNKRYYLLSTSSKHIGSALVLVHSIYFVPHKNHHFYVSITIESCPRDSNKTILINLTISSHCRERKATTNHQENIYQTTVNLSLQS